MNKKKKLHDKLLILAKAKGLTQAEIAKKVGMNSTHINRYFKGSSDLVSDHFVNIVTVLGIDIDYAVTAELTKLTSDENNDVSDLSSSVSFLLNSLDDIGKQTVLNQLLWAAKTAAQAKGKSFPKSLEDKIKKQISLI